MAIPGQPEFSVVRCQFQRARHDAVELEPMNQFAQPTFVTAMGHGMGKGTSDAPARRTSPQTILLSFRAGRKHPVPADRANLATDRRDADQAIEANPQPGNIQQWLAANAAAIRREENGEETFRWSLNPDADSTGRTFFRNNGMPCNYATGVAGPDLVLITAEDGLLVVPAVKSAAVNLCCNSCSIAAMLHLGNVAVRGRRRFG